MYILQIIPTIRPNGRIVSYIPYSCRRNDLGTWVTSQGTKQIYTYGSMTLFWWYVIKASKQIHPFVLCWTKWNKKRMEMHAQQDEQSNVLNYFAIQTD
jgi:hypothetical protein